jgi:hypothetical protein
MQEIIRKIEISVENLKEKKSRIYFFVQDTKGNPRASIKHTYDMAMSLKKSGFNTIILHEKPDYFGVQNWLGEEFMTLPHQPVEGQNLEISPEDFIIVPEIFGYVMSQISNLPCGKVVLCQAYDYIFETLQPGQSWSDMGFTKCIITGNKLKDHVSSIMRAVSYDVLPPVIDNIFTKSELPVKPIVSVHSRDQRDTMNLIKTFYQKYPQYRWVRFRDLRNLSQKEFATQLQDSMVSVWLDDTSSFGTFPLESMMCGVPVIGKLPNLLPDWINENNGIWIQDVIKLTDIIADYIQNWLEDNISVELYSNMESTPNEYSDRNKFDENISNLFQGYFNLRMENFKAELDKHAQTTEQ